MSSPIQPEPVVTLERVTVVLDGKQVLSDIDWVIEPGQRWVLFGANGSGKTTLMEVVSTYLHPTRGRVSVLGAKVGKVDVRAIRPRIGYVGPAPTALMRPSFPALDIVITGLHASFVGTRWHAYEEEDWERARACLRSLHAEEFAEREFGTLSEGERKRVLIARCLMGGPELLLLDEPASGLDLGARERLIESLAFLAADPASPPAVLVTHHVEEIPPGFGHILMLAGGRVVASGPLDDVLTSGTLSDTFGMPLELARSGHRWRAWSPAVRTSEDATPR